MRKLLFTFVFAIMAMTTFAQGDHMTFKGIPMQGPLNAFVQKLKGKGFTYVETYRGYAFLKGKFASYDNCRVMVGPENNNVSFVRVEFPDEWRGWKSLASTYYSLKNILTEKYGTPKTIERFSNGDPGDDISRVQAILKGECIYKSEFKTKKGNINLFIDKFETNYNPFVVITYEDNKHEAAKKKTMMDDL